MIGARVGRQCWAGDCRHQQWVRSAGMSLVVLIMMVVGAIPAGAEPSPDLRRALELLKVQMERKPDRFSASAKTAVKRPTCARANAEIRTKETVLAR